MPQSEETCYSVVETLCDTLMAGHELQNLTCPRGMPSLKEPQSDAQAVNEYASGRPITFVKDEMLPRFCHSMGVKIEHLKERTVSSLNPSQLQCFTLFRNALQDPAYQAARSLEGAKRRYAAQAPAELSAQGNSGRSALATDSHGTSATGQSLDFDRARKIAVMMSWILRLVYFMRMLNEDMVTPPISAVHGEFNPTSLADITLESYLHDTKLLVFKMKVREPYTNPTNWMQRVHAFVTAESFTQEHKKASTFNPNVPIGGGQEGVAASLEADLYRLAIQPMRYSLHVESGLAVLTDFWREFTLFHLQETQNELVYYVSYCSVPPRPSIEDTLRLVSMLAYIMDRFGFEGVAENGKPLLAYPTAHPASCTNDGAELDIPTAPPTNEAVEVPFFNSLTRLNIGPSLLRDQTLDIALVDGQLTLRVANSWLPYIFCPVNLVLHHFSRQGVILRSVDDLYFVKVYRLDRVFDKEVSTLNALAGIQGVPNLVGTGTTGGGNKFVVMNNTGDVLDEDLSDEEAQEFYESVLKPIHERGYHHHDIHPDNITYDELGAFHLIDYGDAQPNCNFGDNCLDREWLDGHSVSYDVADVFR